MSFKSTSFVIVVCFRKVNLFACVITVIMEGDWLRPVVYVDRILHDPDT